MPWPRDQTCNLGVSGQCSNQLSYPARAKLPIFMDVTGNGPFSVCVWVSRTGTWKAGPPPYAALSSPHLHSPGPWFSTTIVWIECKGWRGMIKYGKRGACSLSAFKQCSLLITWASCIPLLEILVCPSPSVTLVGREHVWVSHQPRGSQCVAGCIILSKAALLPP